MNKKQVLLLASLIILLVVTFISKGINSMESWVGGAIFYALGGYWIYTFVFNKNMYILSTAYPLCPDDNNHKVIRVLIFFAACFLVSSVLLGVK